MVKKKTTVLKILQLIILSLLLVGVVNAFDFWGVIKGTFSNAQGNLITGHLTQGTTELSIAVGNLAPNVTNVSSVPEIGITESGIAFVSISFIATDPDGTGNLNASSASINLTTNEDTTIRFNSSCGNSGTIGSIGLNFTCTLGMVYFDKPGNWTIRASIKDINGAIASNETTNLTLAPTLAIVVGPSSLTFPTISAGSENVTAQQAIAVNNTGNQNVTSNNVRVHAYDLVGANGLKIIPAGNFTIDINSGAGNPQCGVQTVMVNASTTGITNSILPRGNNTLGNSPEHGKEQLFVCLRRAPLGSDLPSQTYSATGGAAWVVSAV